MPMMAMTPSPQDSPIMGGGHRIERQQSNSPPLQPQQLSKRDKRRTMLADRLQEITDLFANNRDHHYRTQLQALQIDMNLIMEARCNEKTPIPNTAEEIDALVRDNIDRTMRASLGVEVPVRAGKIYADFAKEVNDAMEERDAALCTHMRDFNVKMNEIATDHAYRKKLAEVEHEALSKTLRDRLINSVMAKKTRLLKDKESVDIETSSALLLHPSQYGFANPSSPGGIHGKRATRHRREAEEFHNYTENNKRKRKNHDSDESPAPHRQRIDHGSNTPSIYAERGLIAKQIDSALYSVDKLFTEKELAMTYNDSALAAHSYILQHPVAESKESNSPPVNKSELASDHEKPSDHLPADHEHEDTHSPPNGAMMERTFSHATRSTRQHYNTGFGIDVLPDIHYPGTFEAVTSKLPRLPPVSATIVPKTYIQPKHDPYASGGPAGLSVEDAQLEYEVMKRASEYNRSNGLGSNLDKEMGGRDLLDVASRTRGFGERFVQSLPRSLITGEGQGQESSVRGVGEHPNRSETLDIEMAGTGGVPMSRQTTGDSAVFSTPRRRGRGEVWRE